MIIHDRVLPHLSGNERRLIELACADLMDMRECRPRGAQPHGGRSWIGTETVEDFDEKVRYGWPRLEKRMLQMLDEVHFEDGVLRRENAVQRRRHRRELGNEVDIHRVYQGRLDTAWERTERNEEDRWGSKFVHLAVNIDANAATTFEDTLWRGAVVMRLYETLVSMGKSVAITVYDYSVGGLTEGYGGKRISSMSSCKVKTYADQLLADKLASMINVGFMRRCFMEHVQCSHPEYRASYGRGRATDDFRVLPKAVEDDLKNGGRVIVIGHAFSKSAAERVLQDFVTQYVRGEAVTDRREYQWLETRSTFRLMNELADILPKELSHAG